MAQNPAIKPQIAPKPPTVALTLQLPQDIVDRLDAYVRFLGGATDRSYVVEHALRKVFDSDKDFRAHLAAQAAAVEVPLAELVPQA